jgi:hypothetical protein
VSSDLYEIVDPRPIAAEAKYTYFLPSAPRLAAVGVGDLVKLAIRAVPPSDKWDLERMWVKVTSAEAERLEGALDNEPDDMPNVHAGVVIRFPRTHILAVIFEDSAREAVLDDDGHREHWERCMVDQAVIDGDVHVGFLYRETPDLAGPDDKYPDSGWRIRGDMRDATDDEINAREVAYVALGLVLNRDDSWLHLIDEPIGVRYEKNFETGEFIQVGPTGAGLN